jgi:membrane protein
MSADLESAESVIAKDIKATTSRVNSIKSQALARLAAARKRWHWLDHLIRAWTSYKADRGDHLAAAVTFFSFLSLFPLILLGVAIAGFVLSARPSLQDRLFTAIADNVPGDFGTTISSSIHTAIDSRTSVGLIGLGTILLTGLGWIANLRAAVTALWGQAPLKQNFLKAKLADLGVLAGLGLGLVLSLSLTIAGAALTPAIMRTLNVDHLTGISFVAAGASILIAAAGDVLVLGWMLIRLPQVSLPWRVSLRGAILAAAGFEFLKLIGTYYIAKVTHSPTAGVFGSVIGILVWVNLVSRFLLYCVSWLATANAPAHSAIPLPAMAVPVHQPPETEVGPSPAATAATLIGAGAVIGAGATVGARLWWRHGRR